VAEGRGKSLARGSAALATAVAISQHISRGGRSARQEHIRLTVLDR